VMHPAEASTDDRPPYAWHTSWFEVQRDWEWEWDGMTDEPIPFRSWFHSPSDWFTALTDGGLVVEAVRPLSRLRVGAEVQGWAGGPTDVVKDDHLLRSGVVSAAHVDTAGRLTLRVSDAVTRPAPFAVGSQVCLRPKAVEPFQQMRGRRQIKHRYRSDGNWLAGRGRPTPLRTDVPLDVVLAAADDA
jgi:hypothetical protein